jgi:integrase
MPALIPPSRRPGSVPAHQPTGCLRIGRVRQLSDRHAPRRRPGWKTAPKVDDDPKSETGKRPVNLSTGLRGDVERHLDRDAQPGPDGRLFLGSLGGIPRRRNFNPVWKAALDRAKIPAEMDLHLHDPRHTGSTWSARSGATLRELMARIGHFSTRAGMIYQRASRDRDQAIAAAFDALIVEARTRAEQ